MYQDNSQRFEEKYAMKHNKYTPPYVAAVHFYGAECHTKASSFNPLRSFLQEKFRLSPNCSKHSVRYFYAITQINF